MFGLWNLARGRKTITTISPEFYSVLMDLHVTPLMAYNYLALVHLEWMPTWVFALRGSWLPMSFGFLPIRVTWEGRWCPHKHSHILHVTLTFTLLYIGVSVFGLYIAKETNTNMNSHACDLPFLLALITHKINNSQNTTKHKYSSTKTHWQTSTC